MNRNIELTYTPGPYRTWKPEGKDEYPEPSDEDLRIVGANDICIGIVFGNKYWPETLGNAERVVTALNDYGKVAPCDVCLAEKEFGDCICNGYGTNAEEKVGLRLLVVKLQEELATEKKLSAACSRDCNATALERNNLRTDNRRLLKGLADCLDYFDKLSKWHTDSEEAKSARATYDEVMLRS